MRLSALAAITSTAACMALWAGMSVNTSANAGAPARGESVAQNEPFSKAQWMLGSKDLATRTLATRIGVEQTVAAELMAAQASLKSIDTSGDPGFVELLPEYTADLLDVRYLTRSEHVPPGIIQAFESRNRVAVRVVRVPYTIDQLAETGLRVGNLLDVPFDSTLSPEDGTVVFITAQPPRPEVKKQVEDAAAPVGVKWRVEPLSRPTVGGGGAMTTCTGGFTVKVIGGTNTGISTAGHCGDSQVYTGPTVSTAPGGEAWSGNADLQWMDNPIMSFDASVWLGSSPNWPVQHRKNWDNVGINDDVCRYGKLTAGCGTIRDKWFRPYGYVSNATYSFGLMSGTTSIEGDSGGPIHYGTTAWGIQSGYTGSGLNIFTPQDRLETRLGVQVRVQ